MIRLRSSHFFEVNQMRFRILRLNVKYGTQHRWDFTLNVMALIDHIRNIVCSLTNLWVLVIRCIKDLVENQEQFIRIH
ncbi:hypothetical protein D3C85_1700380 [compost metagenome]